MLGWVLLKLPMKSLMKVIAGMSVGSLASAGWFHVATLAAATGPSGVDTVQKHTGLVVFQAFFVFLIFALIGVPAFLIARRLSLANAVSASVVGLVAGLLVSTLYGGPDFRSFAQFAVSLVTFGGSGTIAAFTFWMFVRNTTSRSR